MKKKFKYVEVLWLDAVMSGGWENLARLVTPEPVISRGWLVADEKEHIVLASSIGAMPGDEDVGGTIAIRKADILKQRRLKV